MVAESEIGSHLDRQWPVEESNVAAMEEKPMKDWPKFAARAEQKQPAGWKFRLEIFHSLRRFFCRIKAKKSGLTGAEESAFLHIGPLNLACSTGTIKRHEVLSCLAFPLAQTSSPFSLPTCILLHRSGAERNEKGREKTLFSPKSH